MKYYCLLRGINVSGKRLVKMELLREVFVKMQLVDVKTFIQSGNVVFEAGEVEEQVLVSGIENKLLECFGYSIPTFVRTDEQWCEILKSSPYRNAVEDKNNLTS